MTWEFAVCVVVLAAAIWASAVVRALIQVSRSALEKRLRAQGREDQGVWLFDHLDAAQHSVSLLRLVLRLAVYALVLVQIVGTGEEASLTWPDLAVAGLVTAVALWVFSSILATALARHASVGLISGVLPGLRVLTIALLPFTRALGFVDEAVRRLSGANLREPDEEAEAELLRSIGDTHREGGLDEKAATLLENVVEFATTDVGEVMTPRTDIDGIELTDDLAAIRNFITEVGHSRIPVYEKDLDHIVGVLYVKDLIEYLGEEARDFALRPILRAPIIVPETKPVDALLGDFQRGEVHMAIVIDEYGGTAGLVTIEDVLEEIVGEIQDEHDPEQAEVPSLDTIDETRLEVDGRFHIDDLNEQLGLDLPEDEEFDTIAGYVLATLGRVPAVGESFVSDTARFTTLAATATHVSRVGIELLEPTNGDRRRRNGG
ncbi:MAG: HlyC/CorC family transporter [Planctomycetes bacterium]|nr:HlyC/CorC family transporter [Planctomycetota bacterium]